MDKRVSQKMTPRLFSLKLSPLTGIYLVHALRALGASLVGVYIPIYFLELDFSLSEVFIFWLTYSFGVFFFCLLATYISCFWGLKKIVIISFLLQFAYLYSLYHFPEKSYFLPAVFLLSSLETAFYWFPVNVFFATHSRLKQMGRNVGWLHAFPKILTFVTPLLAGLIILRFGFGFLFVVCAFFYTLCLFPLISIPELKSKNNFHFSKYQRFFKKHARYFAAEFLENIRKEA